MQNLSIYFALLLPSSAYRRPNNTSPTGSLKRFSSISLISKTINGLGSPLISATTRLFTKIRFLLLPPITIPKKVIYIKIANIANIANLYNLEKLTTLRITS